MVFVVSPMFIRSFGVEPNHHHPRRRLRCLQEQIVRFAESVGLCSCKCIRQAEIPLYMLEIPLEDQIYGKRQVQDILYLKV